MSWYKFGFHATATGNLNGIGQYISELRQNNKPVFLQSTDSAGVIFEACNSGSHPQDGLVFRRTLGEDPNTNTRIDRLPEMGEAYVGDPVQIANERWALLMSLWPSELEQYSDRIWTASINEPSKELQNYDYLGRYALEQGRLAIEQDRKVLAFGWSGGTPNRAFWESFYVLEYLKMCAAHPNNVGISLHEYSFDDNSIKTGHPFLLGRFQVLHDVCDTHGINRPTIHIGEFGAGENAWLGSTNHKMTEIQWAQDMYEPYDNILGACCWTLGLWGGTIVQDVLSLVAPITDVAKNYPYSPPDPIEPQPPIEPPIEPPINPPESTDLFKVDYTGWGERDNQEPVGWYDSTVCVNVQVPYAIFPDTRLPMGFENFEGDNPYGDGESWNDFTCPEAVIKWDDLLPPDEHYYLNDQGRTQHWFCPAKAGRSRFNKVIHLEAGTYRLTFDGYGDFAQIVNGVKVPQNDPQHGQIELFIGEQGIDDMIDIALIGDNHIVREFTVTGGEYEVGYGLLSRWAAGGGTAGFFLKGFSIEKITETEPPIDPPIEPPVDAPKIVIVKKPQIANMTYGENEVVSEWAWDNYGRTATHSTDDMLTMLRAGNEESYAVVWWADRQYGVLEALVREGFNYILMPETQNATILSIPHMAQYGGGADARSNDCGAACCAMIINGETDNDPTVDEIALTYQNPPNSYMSFNQLDQALNGYDMDGTHKRPSYAQHMSDEVMNGKASIGLVWYQALPETFSNFNGSHFVVVYGTDGESLYYHDPLCPDSRTTTISFANMDEALRRVNEGGNSSYQTMDTVVKDTPPVEPPDPPTGNVDLLPYLRGNGVLYEVSNASGGNERFQTQSPSNGEFWQTKNSLAEQILVDANYIYRGWDVSPGNGRYYVQQQNGQQFAKWLPRFMSVGQQIQTSLYVQFYNWDCQEDPLNSGGVTDTRKFIAKHNIWTSRAGITLNDVVELEWQNGGETYFYARDYGLVGWERSHQDPHTPSWSAISEIHQPGQRPDNVVNLPNCL